MASRQRRSLRSFATGRGLYGSKPVELNNLTLLRAMDGHGGNLKIGCEVAAVLQPGKRVGGERIVGEKGFLDSKGVFDT